ncbi:hypothetical protein [Nevskia sp.]|uniref:hypothetical protein n=1 Tax=Nevskia sp. TaxID=1929292 RepID=UPI0025EFE70F|nr:hypothetical protein [Nevskia sp.]
MTVGFYRITDHICRECRGRILERVDVPGGGFRCSNCGATVTKAVEELCACGMRIESAADLGFRCEPNPEPTFKFPHEIIVRKRTPEDTAAATKQIAIPLR